MGPTEAPPSTATCLHGDMPACTATCVRAHGSVHRHGNVPCTVTLGDEPAILSCKRGQLVSGVAGNLLPRLVASYLPGALEIRILLLSLRAPAGLWRIQRLPL